jgi:hypothetical protein
MALFDNFKYAVKAQLEGTGTSKFGWLESLSEFLTTGVIIALCISHKWYVPAVILVVIIIAMIFVVSKK